MRNEKGNPVLIEDLKSLHPGVLEWWSIGVLIKNIIPSAITPKL
jgi:hypothetical protein